MKYTHLFALSFGALLLAGAAFSLPPFEAASSFAAAKSPASVRVDRQLAKLRRQTNSEIRAQERTSASARQDRLREQMRPHAPQNAVERRNDRTQDRIEELRDKLADQKKTAEEQQPKK